jgi:hypothetical protein
VSDSSTIVNVSDAYFFFLQLRQHSQTVHHDQTEANAEMLEQLSTLHSSLSARASKTHAGVKLPAAQARARKRANNSASSSVERAKVEEDDQSELMDNVDGEGEDEYDYDPRGQYQGYSPQVSQYPPGPPPQHGGPPTGPGIGGYASNRAGPHHYHHHHPPPPLTFPSLNGSANPISSSSSSPYDGRRSRGAGPSATVATRERQGSGISNSSSSNAAPRQRTKKRIPSFNNSYNRPNLSASSSSSFSLLLPSSPLSDSTSDNSLSPVTPMTAGGMGASRAAGVPGQTYGLDAYQQHQNAIHQQQMQQQQALGGRVTLPSFATLISVASDHLYPAGSAYPNAGGGNNGGPPPGNGSNSGAAAPQQHMQQGAPPQPLYNGGHALAGKQLQDQQMHHHLHQQQGGNPYTLNGSQAGHPYPYPPPNAYRQASPSGQLTSSSSSRSSASNHPNNYYNIYSSVSPSSRTMTTLSENESSSSTTTTADDDTGDDLHTSTGHPRDLAKPMLRDLTSVAEAHAQALHRQKKMMRKQQKMQHGRNDKPSGLAFDALALSPSSLTTTVLDKAAALHNDDDSSPRSLIPALAATADDVSGPTTNSLTPPHVSLAKPSDSNPSSPGKLGTGFTNSSSDVPQNTRTKNLIRNPNSNSNEGAGQVVGEMADNTDRGGSQPLAEHDTSLPQPVLVRTFPHMRAPTIPFGSYPPYLPPSSSPSSSPSLYRYYHYRTSSSILYSSSYPQDQHSSTSYQEHFHHHFQQQHQYDTGDIQPNPHNSIETAYTPSSGSLSPPTLSARSRRTMSAERSTSLPSRFSSHTSTHSSGLKASNLSFSGWNRIDANDGTEDAIDNLLALHALPSSPSPRKRQKRSDEDYRDLNSTSSTPKAEQESFQSCAAQQQQDRPLHAVGSPSVYV